MGIEPAAAQGRVAGKAIALGVTRRAALQVLSRRLSVTHKEELLGIVISGVELALGAQSRLHMAVGAELGGIVAVAAAGFPGVRRCRMQ
jgi:hypothetical protein